MTRPEPDRIGLAQELVRLSRADWGFADLYLRDAESVLRPVCGPDDLARMRRQRNTLPDLAIDARRALLRSDWAEARRLAERGVELRERIRRESNLHELAEAVYGPRRAAPDAFGLALAGAVSRPRAELEETLRERVRAMRSLASSGLVAAAFYEARAAHFEQHRIVDAGSAPPTYADPVELREQALGAADADDFARLLDLAERAARARIGPSGRFRPPPATPEVVAGLATSFPGGSVAAAAELGLRATVLESRPEVNAYLRCACVESAVLPREPLSASRRQPEGRTCGHACPPGVRPSLKSSLDALMAHPFLCSGGTRYLPWFGEEALLVETFPEQDPDAAGALLGELGLSRRRGLPRVTIENALLRQGPRLCEDLGLDPTEYRVVCVPFDAYNRLDEAMGWGRQERWTHFDGYQVTRELRLQAIVGGDARFGGPDDLCGVGPGYDSQQITARFALVRRKRFRVREVSDVR